MTSINTARRAFLRGDIREQRTARYMPWAVENFEALCQRCDDCIRVCEESVLVRGDGGYPNVDFRKGGCTFCGACVEACEYEALGSIDLPPWQAIARIGDNCLQNKGVTCRTCGDICDRRAIRFMLRVGGSAEMRLQADDCTGCGACIPVCPVQAISIAQKQKSESTSPHP